MAIPYSCIYVLLFSFIGIFLPVIFLDQYFCSIVKLAAKTALKENAEQGAGLRNHTQNRKWQGTKHRVQVSLSWSGNLCTALLIPWEPRNPGLDLKSALHQDKKCENHSVAYSWCLPHSKPHSSKTQTGIGKSLCGILKDVRDGKGPVHRNKGVGGTSLAAGHPWAPSSQNRSTTWTKAQEMGTAGRFAKSSWPELKPDRCMCTLKDNPPR